MPHTITVSSRIFSSDDSQTQRADFKLPLTEFRSISNVQLPGIFNYLLDEDSSFTVDLSQFGTKLRLLAVKSTRPVSLALATNDVNVTYNYPPMTFFHHFINSSEDLAPRVESITITVPPQSTSTTGQLPARYPKALVEMFVLYE
jgi:hypothetical protein